MQTFNNATITAFGYGLDNAYQGHPDGGDCVARTRDPKRNFGGAAHAVLGSGVFLYPTSMAVRPESEIPYGSMVYVHGMGWFIVEDHCKSGFPEARFDMWSGPSSEQEMSNLTGKMNVTVYSDPNDVPPDLRAMGPSQAWTSHFDKMKERINRQGLALFVAP